MHVPYPISWADEERDLTAWLGNEMQDEAFSNLYSLSEKMSRINDPDIQRDWRYLQTSDHFYYMCTKWFSDGDVHKYYNPYDSPYDAFINFMNAFSDFSLRVDSLLNGGSTEQPSPKLAKKSQDVDKLIDEYEAKILELKAQKSKKSTAKTSTKAVATTKKPPVAKTQTASKKAPAAKKESVKTKKATTQKK
jgi:alpha-amylase